MIGGMICPTQLAVASTAAAYSGVKPVRFISGMVKEPVLTTFAGPEPLIDPKKSACNHGALGWTTGIATCEHVSQIDEKLTSSGHSQDSPEYDKDVNHVGHHAEGDTEDSVHTE